MKRFIAISIAIMLLLFTSIFIYIYQFDINRYQAYIEQQLHQKTGYQIQIGKIDNQLWADSQLIISNLSISLDQQQLVQIKQLRIELANLDLWQRHLQVSLIELTAVDIEIDKLSFAKFNNKAVTVQSSDINEATVQSLTQLPWSELGVDSVIINGLNAQVSDGEQSVQLSQADIEIGPIVLIKAKQFANEINEINIKTNLETLKLDSLKGTIEANKLQLSSNLQPKKLTADLKFSAKQLSISDRKSAETIVNDSQLLAILTASKLDILNLSAQLWGGEVLMKASSHYQFNPFRKPMLSVKQLDVNTLRIDHLNINLANLMQTNKQQSKAVNVDNQQSELSLQQVNLHNISIEDLNIKGNQQLPLQVQGFDSQIQNLQLQISPQLILADLTEQKALLQLNVDLLNWQDSKIEGFQLTGSLFEKQQSLQAIIEGLFAG